MGACNDVRRHSTGLDTYLSLPRPASRFEDRLFHGWVLTSAPDKNIRFRLAAPSNSIEDPGRDPGADEATLFVFEWKGGGVEWVQSKA